MRLRPLTAGLVLASLLTAPLACAGLGGIRLLAGQGEPFFAEVSIEPEPGMGSPFATLAPRDRYASLAPYSEKAARLQVQTVEVSPGRYMVRLSGPLLQPGETFNFALELIWPSGRVVREYRINAPQPGDLPAPAKHDGSAAMAERPPLLDGNGLPVFGEGRLLSSRGLPLHAEVELLGEWPQQLSAADFSLRPAAGVRLDDVQLTLRQVRGRQWLMLRSTQPWLQPRLAFTLQGVAQEHKVQRNFAFSVPGRQLRRGPAAVLATGQLQYRVQSGDTLLGIAKRARHDGESLQGAAERIFAANPSAFARGDRNRLFAGAQLQLAASEVPPSAAAEVAQPVPPSPTKPVADASAPTAAKPAVDGQAQAATARQLHEAQQRLAWLEAEIQRLSRPQPSPSRVPGARVLPVRPSPAAVDLPAESFIDDNLTQWVLTGAGGLSVASLLAWLLVRQRRRSRPSLPLRPHGPLSPMTVSANLGPDEQPLAHPIAADINLQTIDVLAEAEVLMAYGRFDAAEQLLRESLAQEPEREDLRLKLLDLIARKGNKREFEEVALDLLAVFGPQSALWGRVLQLGATLDPDNPLYREVARPTLGSFVLNEPAGEPAPASGPDEIVPLGQQAASAAAAADLARLYREMGDRETADTLLREASSGR